MAVLPVTDLSVQGKAGGTDGRRNEHGAQRIRGTAMDSLALQLLQPHQAPREIASYGLMATPAPSEDRRS